MATRLLSLVGNNQVSILFMLILSFSTRTEMKGTSKKHWRSQKNVISILLPTRPYNVYFKGFFSITLLRTSKGENSEHFVRLVYSYVVVLTSRIRVFLLDINVSRQECIVIVCVRLFDKNEDKKKSAWLSFCLSFCRQPISIHLTMGI